MAFRADCQQDRSADVLGAGGTRDCTCVWRSHIDQLKPMAVEHSVEVTDTDAAEVSQRQVASTPPAPIQLSAPPNVVGTVSEIPEADQLGMVPVSAPTVPEVSEAIPASPTVRERRYPQRVRRAPQRLDL